MPDQRQALEQALEEDRRNGVRPWLVIASAGTVDTGAVDPLRNTAYFGTGNNYTVDDESWQCARDAKAKGEDLSKCVKADNYPESIMALDLSTGRIMWA